MRNTVLLALLLAAAPAARAADPALLADIGKDLSVDQKKYDERAVLAALLARPSESAAFDAEGREALQDPALRPLFVAKWRGKAALFAETESNIPNIDAKKRYANWSEIMSPEQKAFTLQRMKSMDQDDKDKLVYYLNKLNENLKADGGNLDAGLLGVSHKIADGVMDKYRQDLKNYLATPQAQTAEKGEADAAKQLASALDAKHQPTQVAAATPATQPATKPSTQPAAPAKPAAPKPTEVADARPTWQQSHIPRPATPPPDVKPVVPAPTPVAPAPISTPPPPPGTATGAGPATAPSAPVTVTGPAHGAMDQADAAARAGEAAGNVFDGGASAAPVQAPTATGGTPGLTKPTLAPSAPRTDLTAAPPPSPGAAPAPSAEDDFMNQVTGMGSGKKPAIGHTPLMLGAGGAILGGILGFLLGGPIGMAVGAAVLGGGAYLVTKNFF